MGDGAARHRARAHCPQRPAWCTPKPSSTHWSYVRCNPPTLERAALAASTGCVSERALWIGHAYRSPLTSSRRCESPRESTLSNPSRSSLQPLPTCPCPWPCAPRSVSAPLLVPRPALPHAPRCGCAPFRCEGAQGKEGAGAARSLSAAAATGGGSSRPRPPRAHTCRSPSSRPPAARRPPSSALPMIICWTRRTHSVSTSPPRAAVGLGVGGVAVAAGPDASRQGRTDTPPTHRRRLRHLRLQAAQRQGGHGVGGGAVRGQRADARDDGGECFGCGCVCFVSRKRAGRSTHDPCWPPPRSPHPPAPTHPHPFRQATFCPAAPSPSPTWWSSTLTTGGCLCWRSGSTPRARKGGGGGRYAMRARVTSSGACSMKRADHGLDWERGCSVAGGDGRRWGVCGGGAAGSPRPCAPSPHPLLLLLLLLLLAAGARGRRAGVRESPHARQLPAQRGHARHGAQGEGAEVQQGRLQGWVWGVVCVYRRAGRQPASQKAGKAARARLAHVRHGVGGKRGAQPGDVGSHDGKKVGALVHDGIFTRARGGWVWGGRAAERWGVAWRSPKRAPAEQEPPPQTPAKLPGRTTPPTHPRRGTQCRCCRWWRCPGGVRGGRGDKAGGKGLGQVRGRARGGQVT